MLRSELRCSGGYSVKGICTVVAQSTSGGSKVVCIDTRIDLSVEIDLFACPMQASSGWSSPLLFFENDLDVGLT